MKRIITLAAIAFASLLAADIKPHEYAFRYPMTVSKPCGQAAGEFADALAKSTGVKVERTTCERDYDYFKIRIFYLAVEPLYVVPERDRYSSYAACAEDLARRTERYRRYTGLSPFLAFCALPYRPHSPFGIPDYSADLFLDGFGEPAERPRREEVRLRGRAVDGEIAAADGVSKKLEELGVRVSRVSIVGHQKYESLFAFNYYGERSFTHHSYDYVTLAQCREGIDELKALPNAPPLAGAFCTWNPEPWTAQGHLYVFWDTTKLPGISSERVEGDYKDYAACQADRDRVLGSWKLVGKKAVGALCSARYGSRPYAMSVLVLNGID